MVPDSFHSFYRSQYEDRWAGLLDALNQVPVRCLRLNAFSDIVADPETEFIPELLPSFLPLSNEEPMVDTHGLLSCYRMDPASILPAMELQVQPGDEVLDMCSAPGGKALILAEALNGSGRLTVNEWSRASKEKLRSVLKSHVPKEIMPHIRMTGHDASKWGLYEPNQYDRILLDAPCSSERHVLHQPSELKKWKPSRSKQLAQRQYALLCSALMSSKEGGRIVYSTCSLSRLENDETIRRLLKKKGDRIRCRTNLNPSYGEPTEFGWQILPDHQSGWGPMYWSVLERI